MQVEEVQVRLDFIASIEIGGQEVQRFIQELQDIPTNSWCEVQNALSKQVNGPNDLVHSTIQLYCDRVVADFLCQRFGKQSKHVSRGEIMMVTCKRVHMGKLSSTPAHTTLNGNDAVQQSKENDERSPALPRETVIDLLDCLGDDIAEVYDAFTTHSTQTLHNGPLLSLIGLVHALDNLSPDKSKEVHKPASSHRITKENKKKKEMKAAKAGLRKKEDDKDFDNAQRLSIHRIRQHLQQMMKSSSISIQTLPDHVHEPFMTYTDFIACYVVYLNNQIIMMYNLHRAVDDPVSGSLRAIQHRERRTRGGSSLMIGLLDPLGFPDSQISYNSALESQRSESDDLLTSNASRLNDARTSSVHSNTRKLKSTVKSSKIKTTKKKHTNHTDKNVDPLGATRDSAMIYRENIAAARQNLTSSASRIRPTKQLVVKPSSSIGNEGQYSHNNNDDEVDESPENYGWGLEEKARSDVTCVDSETISTSSDHRPPSRQRHAFPTNLLDARDFFSPAKPIRITPWHMDDDNEPHQEANDQSALAVRPPSRYMTKVKGATTEKDEEPSPTSEETITSRLPSRRGVDSRSWNQAHHDPKTDGFADVDETVPPPFRIEMTTDSYHSQYISGTDVSLDTEPNRTTIQSRNSSQRQDDDEYVMLSTNISHRVKKTTSPWIEKSSPTTRPSHSRHNDQWFCATNNPFFIATPSDDAIATIPLVEDHQVDLMTILPLTDLHLDDFMGETISTESIDPSTSLKTSLDQDFLSLFAQH